MASPGPVLLLHYRSSVTPQKVKLDRCVLIAVVQIYTAALTGSNLFSEAQVAHVIGQLPAILAIPAALVSSSPLPLAMHVRASENTVLHQS
jgi:hypothetical protein